MFSVHNPDLHVAGCAAVIHVGATVRSRGGGSVGGMKMQLTALFAMAAYFVYSTTLAGIITGMLDVG